MKQITLKEVILLKLKELFLNTNLPCDEIMENIIKEHLYIDGATILRNDDYIVLNLPFSDTRLSFTLTLKTGINGIKNWVMIFILKKIKKNFKKVWWNEK